MSRKVEPLKFSWDPREPLMRVTTIGETSAAAQALLDYATQGSERSLAKLKERYQAEYKAGMESGRPVKVPTRRLATLGAWSVKYRWQERVADHERLLYERDLAEWEARRREVRQADYSLGMDLRGRVSDLLKRLPDFYETRASETEDPETGERIRVITVALNASLSQIAGAAKAASDLQRLAVHEPTEIWESLSGAALDLAIERELARLADQRQARLSEGDPGETE